MCDCVCYCVCVCVGEKAAECVGGGRKRLPGTMCVWVFIPGIRLRQQVALCLLTK